MSDSMVPSLQKMWREKNSKRQYGWVTQGVLVFFCSLSRFLLLVSFHVLPLHHCSLFCSSLLPRANNIKMDQVLFSPHISQTVHNQLENVTFKSPLPLPSREREDLTGKPSIKLKHPLRKHKEERFGPPERI